MHAWAPGITLIDVPSDIGASVLGSAMGPQALRVAGLSQALQTLGCHVLSAPAVSGPDNPGLAPVNGYRHLAEVLAWNQGVYQAVQAVLTQSRLPIVCGGDHSLAIGSLSAVSDHCAAVGKRLRVLWLDAHADFNTSDITPSGNLHGMPVACLCGLGPRGLIDLGARVPALDPSCIRLVGVRSVDAQEKFLVHQHGLEVFDMRYIDEHGMRQAIDQALLGVDEQTHLHVSLDIDFLDPAIAPGVGTPVQGGPTYREAQLCMEMIADSARLGSLDIMELNPARDTKNASAEVAVDLIQSLFGKSTLMRTS